MVLRNKRRGTFVFSPDVSTEEFYKAEEQEFYGPFADIREKMDYTFYNNYTMERQRLQDSIIEDMLKRVDATGAICNTPTDPWIVFAAGAMSAGKRYTINSLIKNGRFPLLAFVYVDPGFISRHLPDFMLYTQVCPKSAGEMTRKEAGYIAEILTYAACEKGQNVVYCGVFKSPDWFSTWFSELKTSYPKVRIAMLHIDAPREVIFERAKEKALETGFEVPEDELETALKNASNSAEVLKPKVDYFCKLYNDPEANDVHLRTEGETWGSFKSNWLQLCKWVPGMNKSSTEVVDDSSNLISSLVANEISVHKSSEENHRSDDMKFYGKFASIRENLDYSYHSNYTKERQNIQDYIIEDMLECASITDVNGDVCTTPDKPWIVFTAGAMGAGKGYTIATLVKKKHFPLLAFVSVDPDEIRRHLPEFMLYSTLAPENAGNLTNKECGYISEILTTAGLQTGKNVIVDGSLRDSQWYQIYFGKLKSDYPDLKIAILHVVAPREAVFERAEARAKQTGRQVPRKLLEDAMEQVPRSVKILAPLADYFAELNNAPGKSGIELLTEGECWDTFRSQWLQLCKFVPGGQRSNPFGRRRARLSNNFIEKPENISD